MNPVRTYLLLVEKPARPRWAIQILVALLGSVVESVGALLFLFLLTNISQPGNRLVLPLIGNLQDRFPGVPADQLFVFIAGGIGLFFLLRAVLVVVQSSLQNSLIYGSGVRLSSRLVRTYLSRDYTWHLQRNSAELIRNTYESVNQIVGYVFAPFVAVASDALVIVGLLVVLLVKAPLITVLAIVVLAPLVYGLLRLLQPRYLAVGATNEEMTARALKTLQQGFGGIRDIKMLGVEDYFEAGFTRTRELQARALTTRGVLFDVARPVVDSVVIVLILAFLAFERLVGASTQGSLAILGLFAYAVLRMLPAINRMVANVGAIRYGEAAVDQIGADLAASEGKPPAVVGLARPLPLRQTLVLDNVSLRYHEHGDAALAGVSLEILAGDSIGIVGPTGCGKTTLIDVVSGLLRPDSGRVLADGQDIGPLVREWQAAIGVVPQSVFLVDDTVRRNIALGLRDEAIDEEAMQDALRLARLEEFVGSLQEGLDTVVGERGVRLSGGQRQRIAIARALYRRPSVVIFDEGTSALDNLTEAELVRELELLRGSCTIITVAHRLTTVRDCDRIVVMGAGRIIDIGTWDQLVSRSEPFRALTQKESRV